MSQQRDQFQMRVTAIPTDTYPRVIKRVGKSPPQYPAE